LAFPAAGGVDPLSRGGQLARALATLAPEQVSRAISLGANRLRRSHVGLIVNRKSYRAIAAALAAPELRPAS